MIKNDFSKSNLGLERKEINLSATKINKKKDEDEIAVENLHVKRQQDARREVVNVEESPIKKLQSSIDLKYYESSRPG